MRFHMPTHSAPLRPLRPTFPDNEMRGSFRVRKKKKLCLLNLNAHLISLFLKEPRKEAKYHQIILGKSSATTLLPLISPRLASPRLPYLTTPGDFYCSSIAPMDTRTMAGEGGRKEGGGGVGWKWRKNRSERPPQQRAGCQSPPQVGFRDTRTHACTVHRRYLGELKIHWKRAETRERRRDRDGIRGKWGKKKKVGEQMGQRGCEARWAWMMQRSEKEFKERKVDSLKVITCHKLPGQQA